MFAGVGLLDPLGWLVAGLGGWGSGQPLGGGLNGAPAGREGAISGW